MWISSAGAWGAICLWDDEEAAGSHPSVAGQVGPLIGYGPTSIQQFAVETPTTEIDDLGAIMAGLGMARRSPGRDGAALIPLARLSPEG
ncbi:hypothetical protein [Actinoplanes sp. NPDC051494]|uniref:hypothetical protein n=1 Tax=Actinoplanes sp. NPDC051494 TaxID=3363907 RepID=UPI00378860B8